MLCNASVVSRFCRQELRQGDYVDLTMSELYLTNKPVAELPPKDTPSSQRSQIAKPAPGSVSRSAKHAAKRTRQKLERNPTSGAKHASEPIPSADKQPGCKSLQAGVKS